MTITNTIIKENLIKVKALINDPTHWTQGEFARDATGSPTLPYHKDAICFCLRGSAMKIAQSNSSANAVHTNIMHHIKSAISIITNTPVNECRAATYNDTHTHTEVIAILDKAIELCD